MTFWNCWGPPSLSWLLTYLLTSSRLTKTGNCNLWMWSHWLQSRSTRPLIHQGSIPSSFDWRYCDSLHFKILLLDIIRKPCTASTTLLSGTNVKLNVDALIMHRRLFSAEAKTFCDFFFFSFFLNFFSFYFLIRNSFRHQRKSRLVRGSLNTCRKKWTQLQSRHFYPNKLWCMGGESVKLSVLAVQ